MSMRTRPRPYIWATWLAAALGDDNCEWKSWFKAHFQDYDKRTETDESRNRLAQWAADHDLQVRQVSDELISEGWATVRREGQTKFNISGQHALVGGKADVLAFGASEFAQPLHSVRISGDLLGELAPDTGRALVVDVKTGRPTEKDYWQVVVYMVMLPLAFKDDLAGMSLVGEVRYTNASVPEDQRRRVVTLEPSHRARVLARVREIATQPEPPRTPSARECRYCDIGPCPDRVEADAPDAETEEF